MKEYNDKLQKLLEVAALSKRVEEEETQIFWGDSNMDTEIGMIMFRFNLFYDEAKERWQQALKTLKK